MSMTAKRALKVEDDPWLRGLLQRPCYKVVFENASVDRDATRAELERTFGIAGEGFYTAKIPTDEISTAGTLASAGFFLVDTNVVFSVASPTGPVSSGAAEFRLRLCASADGPAVRKIAGSSFVYSRFHLDPLFDTREADLIKEAWVGNYVDNRRGDSLWVAETDGRIAGFLAVLETDSAFVIDLIAVDRAFQGKGAGLALTRHFIEGFSSKGKSLIVGTQVSNRPSIRLYESAGFRLIKSFYVFHAHVRNGKAVTL